MRPTLQPNQQNQKKLQAEVKSAEKADDEYKKLVEKLKTIESRFYDSEMPQILSVSIEEESFFLSGWMDGLR